MKTITSIITGYLILFMVGAGVSSGQETYTFINSSNGPMICIGTWVPSNTVGGPGTCEGTLMGMDEWTALSTRQSADRLDSLLTTMNSIDEKMSINIDQTSRLLDATRKVGNAIDAQVRQTNQFLHKTIEQRFAAVPQEILSNEAFKQELMQLKKDILSEVDKYYQPKPTSSQ